MSLEVGSRLAHYDVTALIGVGGMVSAYVRIVGLTGAVFLLGAAHASGQTKPTQPSPDAAPIAKTRTQIGIGVLGGVPLGEFENSIDSAGGVSGHVGVGLGESVVSLGGEVGFLWYGGESRTVPLSTTIPDALVNVNTNNYFLMTHARLRVQPREGRWRPYLDGLLGFNYIFTRTSVDVGGSAGGSSLSSIAGTTNIGDFGLSYGGGGGVMVAFSSWPSSLSLDVSMRYIAGSEADYLTEGAIRREGGQAFLDVSSSRTDLFAVYVGVIWER